MMRDIDTAQIAAVVLWNNQGGPIPTFTVPRTDHSYRDSRGVTIHYYAGNSPNARAHD